MKFINNFGVFKFHNYKKCKFDVHGHVHIIYISKTRSTCVAIVLFISHQLVLVKCDT